MSEVANSCRHCGASIDKDGARFCTRCGKPTSRRALTPRQADWTESRNVASVGTIFAGILVGVGLGAWATGLGEWIGIAVQELAVGAAVALALYLARPLLLREWFPWRTTFWWWVAAPAVAAISYLFSAAWVAWIRGFATGVEVPDAEPITPILIMAVGVLAPIVEELSCRGVLHAVLLRLTTPLATLMLTSALFALMHGLNGGFLLEIPHRFVAGIAFGMLRARSGSVATAILAHAVHNAAAVWIG